MPTFASLRPRPALILGALLLCALTLPVRAATLYVSPVGSDDNSVAIASPYKTIQAAVNNASSGDTIALAYAIYQGNGNRDIDFAGKSLSIVSSIRQRQSDPRLSRNGAGTAPCVLLSQQREERSLGRLDNQKYEG